MASKTYPRHVGRSGRFLCPPHLRYNFISFIQNGIHCWQTAFIEFDWINQIWMYCVLVKAYVNKPFITWMFCAFLLFVFLNIRFTEANERRALCVNPLSFLTIFTHSFFICEKFKMIRFWCGLFWWLPYWDTNNF